MAPPTRRTFLRWVATALGTTAAGAGSWWAGARDGGPTAEAAAATVGKRTAATSSTTTVPPTTTAASTTTAAPAGEPTRAASSSTTTAPEAPVMVSRAEWGARPAQGDFTEHTIVRMTVHHTAAFLATASDAPAHVRQHQRYHQDEKGWPDIAYHFIVDSAGRVFEGRPTSAKGDTATSYDPTGHFLVCCEGDLNRQAPARAQIDALVSMLAWGAKQFGVSPATIRGHRDYAPTMCPGSELAPMIDDGTLESLVRAAM